MKTLGWEGTVSGRVFAQHLTPMTHQGDPQGAPQGAVRVHAYPVGSEVPPRGSQGTAIDKVPQLQGKESMCLCLP